MRKIIYSLSALLLLLLITVSAGVYDVRAEETPSTITIRDIDYEKLCMKVYKNGNGIVFYSLDGKKSWNEVEGAVYSNALGDYIDMDISWASSSSDVKIYFKGNKETTVVNVVLPKVSSSFKVKYNKAESDFIFSGNDEATDFYWRKSTDYDWHQVSFNTSDPSYILFLQTVEQLRFKGCSLIFRTKPVVGTDEDDCGERPSKEVKVSIPKMAAAPNIKVNVKKMTLNTKSTMEYYNQATGLWVGCGKNMYVGDVAPGTILDTDPVPANVLIRVAATYTKPCSQTAMLYIPAQTEAPAVSDAAGSGVARYEIKSDGKLYLTFPDATKTDPIDYCVVKTGNSFDVSTAKWKTVKASNKVVKLTEKACPEGSKIYFRYSGVTANASKNIDLKLASKVTNITVTWSQGEDTTPTPTP